ncbi:hypothetical protein T484DRAFT_1779251 [Baffinella frigidus]|nr:hypothetical protein T484DRAFT_1779251 [Cryptophyta sp. CCMP2293]
MGDRRAPPLAVAAAAACVLLLGAFVVDVRRAGEGGGVAVLGEQRAYTWGIPTSIGGEEPKRRVPVRSTDSMGEILPAMADETMPPGPFKVSGNGRLVVDAQGMSASPIQLSGKATEANPRWRGSQLAAVRTSGLRAATPRDASNPVGVHVVDTADGKVRFFL